MKKNKDLLMIILYYVLLGLLIVETCFLSIYTYSINEYVCFVVIFINAFVFFILLYYCLRYQFLYRNKREKKQSYTLLTYKAENSVEYLISSFPSVEKKEDYTLYIDKDNISYIVFDESCQKDLIEISNIVSKCVSDNLLYKTIVVINSDDYTDEYLNSYQNLTRLIMYVFISNDKLIHINMMNEYLSSPFILSEIDDIRKRLEAE